MNRFERPALRAMTGYTFGEQPQDGSVIKLNTNENPYAPSPAVAQALADFDVATGAAASPLAEGFRRPQRHAPRAACADWGAVATNGGDELLRLLITTYLEPGQPLATTEPSYSLYPVLAAVQGCPTVAFDLEADFAAPEDLGARAEAAGAGLFCLVNPHAPTGRLFRRGPPEPPEPVFRPGAHRPGLLVLHRRGPENSLANQRHDRVLLLRTYPKGYAGWAPLATASLETSSTHAHESQTPITWTPSPNPRHGPKRSKVGLGITGQPCAGSGKR